MKHFFYTSTLLLLISCTSTNKIRLSNNNLEGEYLLKTDKLYQAYTDMNYHSVILKSDNTYILKKAEINFTPEFNQCEIASRGKWSVLSNDVLELTSEDMYLKQKGFEYELKKESKLSPDTLYIKVNFPKDYQSNVRLNFTFNSNVSKSVETEKTFIAIPKSKYLWAKKIQSINRNHILFSINANVSGIPLYKGRVLFKIFEEDIDTETTNYITINLPNFDRCFFEFEPMKKELIYIKNDSQLYWQGHLWEIKK